MELGPYDGAGRPNGLDHGRRAAGSGSGCIMISSLDRIAFMQTVAGARLDPPGFLFLLCSWDGRQMQYAAGSHRALSGKWAGSTTVPGQVKAAAKVDRANCYHCKVFRRHARESDYRLLLERALLEIDPDRGSQHVRDALLPLEAICRAQQAVLSHGALSAVQEWRGHGPLSEWARHACSKVDTVYPDKIRLDGGIPDPPLLFADRYSSGPCRGYQEDRPWCRCGPEPECAPCANPAKLPQGRKERRHSLDSRSDRRTQPSHPPCRIFCQPATW